MTRDQGGRRRPEQNAALKRFTSVFGMGTGGATMLVPPGETYSIAETAARDYGPSRQAGNGRGLGVSNFLGAVQMPDCARTFNLVYRAAEETSCVDYTICCRDCC